MSEPLLIELDAGEDFNRIVTWVVAQLKQDGQLYGEWEEDYDPATYQLILDTADHLERLLGNAYYK